MTTNIFSLIKELIASHLLGSITLFALFVIFILVVLVLASRVSFKIGLILIFPAILALMGIGINQGLLGINYRWIGVMIVIALAIGGLAFIWYKMAE